MEQSYPIRILATFNLGHSTITQRNDGIIELHCSDDFTYDVEHIVENQACLKEISKGGKVAVLNFTGHFTSITNAGRKHISDGGHQDYIAAEAFLIHSMIQRMLAGFYMKINKPIVPTAYFSYDEKDKAEEWLKSFIN